MIGEQLTEPFVGVYSVKEASLYIRATMERTPIFPRLTTHHLHWWLRQGLGSEQPTEPDANNTFVNFLELVSFRIVATMRALGVPSRQIVTAQDQLMARYGWNYPFAMHQLWVAKPDVFAQLEGVHVAVSRFWQATLAFMEEYLIPVHGLIFDVNQQASEWRPSHGVLINPRFQFGEPCIEGTRIPTETIWAFYKAGDAIETIAQMYYLPTSKVQDALAWEEQIARSTLQ